MRRLCSKCKEEKELNHFYKNKSRSCGLHYECKECMRLCSIKYYENNKQSINKKKNEYYKNKRKNDDSFRIRRNIHNSIKKFLTNRKYNSYALQYTGLSGDQLIEHMESTLKKDCDHYSMHIDHIIPQSLYDHTIESEIYKCWNWKNLRYLEPNQNLSRQQIDISVVRQYNIENLLPKNYEELI